MPQINYLQAMKLKIQYTTLLFFLPVLQKVITTNIIHTTLVDIQFDFNFVVILLLLLSVVRVVAILIFCIALINWVRSGFKLKKLVPCLVSAIAIFCLNYSIKTIINNKTKRVQNRIKNIPNVLFKTNTEII